MDVVWLHWNQITLKSVLGASAHVTLTYTHTHTHTHTWLLLTHTHTHDSYWLTHTHVTLTVSHTHTWLLLTDTHTRESYWLTHTHTWLLLTHTHTHVTLTDLHTHVSLSDLHTHTHTHPHPAAWTPSLTYYQLPSFPPLSHRAPQPSYHHPCHLNPTLTSRFPQAETLVAGVRERPPHPAPCRGSSELCLSHVSQPPVRLSHKALL